MAKEHTRTGLKGTLQEELGHNGERNGIREYQTPNSLDAVVDIIRGRILDFTLHTHLNHIIFTLFGVVT